MMPYLPEDYIVEVIADIYESHNICELGFDVIQLCKDMGYLVLPYESFLEKEEILIKQDRDGFSWYNPKNNKCEIYFNSNRSPRQRRQFTIPHELGHIEFGHVFESHITREMEEVANEFARQLYMPHILLYKKEILTVHEIMSTFDVTETYARTTLDRFSNRIKNHGYDFSENEQRIFEAFDYNRNILK